MGSSYLSKVAIPSAIYYNIDTANSSGSLNYYSMPWERTADWLGGVQRDTGYKMGSLAWGIIENTLGPIAIPAYMLLGY